MPTILARPEKQEEWVKKDEQLVRRTTTVVEQVFPLARLREQLKQAEDMKAKMTADADKTIADLQARINQAVGLGIKEDAVVTK